LARVLPHDRPRVPQVSATSCLSLGLKTAIPRLALAAPIYMGTLRGFPSPPALWLRRAKPGYANAVDGNCERVR
jgi:hypothetical protein